MASGRAFLAFQGPERRQERYGQPRPLPIANGSMAKTPGAVHVAEIKRRYKDKVYVYYLLRHTYLAARGLFVPALVTLGVRDCGGKGEPPVALSDGRPVGGWADLFRG